MSNTDHSMPAAVQLDYADPTREGGKLMDSFRLGGKNSARGRAKLVRKQLNKQSRLDKRRQLRQFRKFCSTFMVADLELIDIRPIPADAHSATDNCARELDRKKHKARLSLANLRRDLAIAELEEDSTLKIAERAILLAFTS